jgi:hypothetical protein
LFLRLLSNTSRLDDRNREYIIREIKKSNRGIFIG